MPAKPDWLLRLPDIRAQLEYLNAPVVDRAVIERIFGLKRRRAIELMHEFGGYQAGRAFLMDRARLLEALQVLESGEGFTAEKRRRERLEDVVEASREHLISTRVRIPVHAAAVPPSLDRLAPGVLLLPGILTIEFQHPVELLEKLYHGPLAMTLRSSKRSCLEAQMADDLDLRSNFRVVWEICG
jgi:hypothetical protein